jgi:hypothetical protein
MSLINLDRYAFRENTIATDNNPFLHFSILSETTDRGNSPNGIFLSFHGANRNLEQITPKCCKAVT